jgi:alanine racemase
VQTADQLQRFARAIDAVSDAGFQPELRHALNSAALLGSQHGELGEALNLARAGISLYGYAPAPWLSGHAALEPVMTWKTQVIHVKAVQAGASVSYDATWTAQRPSRIATLPVGYADGYLRAYSNRAEVLVRGRRARVVGRVCMDMCMVDVTDVPAVVAGDEVVLLGRQGDQRIEATELAQLANTISYEVLCAVSSRVPRELVEAPAPEVTC